MNGARTGVRMSLVGALCTLLFAASVVAVGYACYGWYRGGPLPYTWRSLFLGLGLLPHEVSYATIVATVLCCFVTKGAAGHAILAGFFVPGASRNARELVQLLGLVLGYFVNMRLFGEVRRLQAVRRQLPQKAWASPIGTGGDSVDGIEVVVKGPNPQAFDGLVGVERAVEEMLGALEVWLKDPERAKLYKIDPARGVLLYGPPGTGKTSLARATAEYFGCPLIEVRPSVVLEKWVGASEKKLSQVFALARHAARRCGKPAIVFIDELDAIGRRRDGAHMNRASDVLLNQLLVELDGVSARGDVFVIGATNRIDVLDEALLRPGRFDRHVQVGLPDFEGRKALFSKLLAERPVLGEIDLDFLARITDGCSPAVIVGICKGAAERAVRRGARTGVDGITMEDLLVKAKEVVKEGWLPKGLS
ncbi:MAG: ATP-binding protein [Bacillota bacterium]